MDEDIKRDTKARSDSTNETTTDLKQFSQDVAKKFLHSTESIKHITDVSKVTEIARSVLRNRKFDQDFFLGASILLTLSNALIESYGAYQDIRKILLPADDTAHEADLLEHQYKPLLNKLNETNGRIRGRKQKKNMRRKLEEMFKETKKLRKDIQSKVFEMVSVNHNNYFHKMCSTAPGAAVAIAGFCLFGLSTVGLLFMAVGVIGMAAFAYLGNKKAKIIEESINKLNSSKVQLENLEKKLIEKISGMDIEVDPCRVL